MRLVSLSPPTRGFLEVNKVRSMLLPLHTRILTFDELNIPLALCATDRSTLRLLSLYKGEVLPAVMASCAVPGYISGCETTLLYRLVDGGVLNNLPVDLVKDWAQKRS